MKTYPVLTPIRAGKGKRYPVGKTIQLSDEDAAPLLACKAIGQASDEETETRPNVKDTIKLVKAAQTKEALADLADGEDRSTVIAEIEKRAAELESSTADKKD